MKRLLLLLAFIPSAAFAQVNTSSPTGFQWSSGSGGSGSIIAGVTLASGCTANWLLYTDSTDHVNCAANMTFDGTVVTFNTATTLRSSAAADGTNSFLKVTGTLPSVTSAGVFGVNFALTSAGSSAQSQYGLIGSIAPGYTGASVTYAGGFYNSAASTGIGFVTGGNVGVIGSSFGSTTGDVEGVQGYAKNANASGRSIAGWFQADSADAASIGAIFQTRQTATVRIGSFSWVSATTDVLPTLASAATVADNGIFAIPMYVAMDNDVKVWSIEDNGSQWAANSKTLTESSATGFARFTLVSGSSFGVNIDYCIEANDSTDFQSRCGMLPIAAVDKAGTITCTVGTVTTATEVVITTAASTLTNTFTCADSGTNFLDIKANATSSLTQTTLRINYFPRQQGFAAVAFTPL